MLPIVELWMILKLHYEQWIYMDIFLYINNWRLSGIPFRCGDFLHQSWYQPYILIIELILCIIVHIH